jgi:uncharacterized protein (TIGR02145 family)
MKATDANRLPGSSNATGGNDTKGFSIVLAGNRNTDGTVNSRGTGEDIWSSNDSGTNVWRRFFGYSNAPSNRDLLPKARGLAVRCVKG